MVALPSRALDPLPLTEDSDGVVRVGGTRVTLDVMVEAFDEGATPEEIVQQYPSLQLADVYTVVAYLLRHRAEIDAYLEQRSEAAMTARRENEMRAAPRDIRERLLARRRQS